MLVAVLRHSAEIGLLKVLGAKISDPRSVSRRGGVASRAWNGIGLELDPLGSWLIGRT